MPNLRLAAQRAARKYNVDPKIFEAMIQQESGFDPDARSGAGAEGIAQFMPETAKGYGVNLHDGRVTDDLEGAARYIADNLKKTGGNYHQALSIYNSGRPDAYRDPGFANGQTFNYVKTILANAGHEPGASGGAGHGVSARGSASTRTTTTRTPGVDNSAGRQAAIASFLGDKKADPVDFALQIRGLQDTPGTTTTRTSKVAGTAGAAGRSGAAAGGGRSGTVKVEPGAERAGIGLQHPVLAFLHQLAGASGREVDVTTGTNHNRMTTSGNVSDHWGGNAADLGVGGDARQNPAVGKKGDLIAAHAIQVASGKSFGEALAMARKGGVFNFETKQGRVQILWRTLTGGNHFNHVHVGVNPNR